MIFVDFTKSNKAVDNRESQNIYWKRKIPLIIWVTTPILPWNKSETIVGVEARVSSVVNNEDIFVNLIGSLGWLTISYFANDNWVKSPMNCKRVAKITGHLNIGPLPHKTRTPTSLVSMGSKLRNLHSSKYVIIQGEEILLSLSWTRLKRRKWDHLEKASINRSNLLRELKSGW